MTALTYRGAIGGYAIGAFGDGTSRYDASASPTGIASTGALAAPSCEVDCHATGAFGTGAVGILTSSISESITGTNATAATGTASDNVQAQPSGIASSCAVGALTAGPAHSVTGNAGTAASGSPTPNIAPAVTGQASTSATGSVSDGEGANVTGTSSTSATGTAGHQTAPNVTGIVATGAQGSLALTSTFTLPGVATPAVIGTAIPNPEQTISGRSTTIAIGSIALTSSVTLAGQASSAATGTLVPQVTTTSVVGMGAGGLLGSASREVDVTVFGISTSSATGSTSGSALPTPLGVASTAHSGTAVANPAQGVTGVYLTEAMAPVGFGVITDCTVHLSAGVAATSATGLAYGHGVPKGIFASAAVAPFGLHNSRLGSFVLGTEYLNETTPARVQVTLTLPSIASTGATGVPSIVTGTIGDLFGKGLSSTTAISHFGGGTQLDNFTLGLSVLGQTISGVQVSPGVTGISSSCAASPPIKVASPIAVFATVGAVDPSFGPDVAFDLTGSGLASSAVAAPLGSSPDLASLGLSSAANVGLPVPAYAALPDTGVASVWSGDPIIASPGGAPLGIESDAVVGTLIGTQVITATDISSDGEVAPIIASPGGTPLGIASAAVAGIASIELDTFAPNGVSSQSGAGSAQGGPCSTPVGVVAVSGVNNPSVKIDEGMSGTFATAALTAPACLTEVDTPILAVTAQSAVAGLAYEIDAQLTDTALGITLGSPALLLSQSLPGTVLSVAQGALIPAGTLTLAGVTANGISGTVGRETDVPARALLSLTAAGTPGCTISSSATLNGVSSPAMAGEADILGSSHVTSATIIATGAVGQPTAIEGGAMLPTYTVRVPADTRVHVVMADQRSKVVVPDNRTRLPARCG